jgi:hypothetical protein
MVDLSALVLREVVVAVEDDVRLFAGFNDRRNSHLANLNSDNT